MSLKRIGKVATLTTAKMGWKDFLVNGGIFVASAAITYITNNMANLDLGTMGPAITAVVALVLKYAQKFIEGLAAKDEEVKKVPNEPDFPVI